MLSRQVKRDPLCGWTFAPRRQLALSGFSGLGALLANRHPDGSSKALSQPTALICHLRRHRCSLWEDRASSYELPNLKQLFGISAASANSE